jgi:hypothetical protein
VTEGTGYDGASLTEEIRLLVELVVEHAAPWLDGLVSAGHGSEQAKEHAEGVTPAGNCGWCPLCAIVNAVHGEQPEFAVRLMEQAAQLVALLRAVLADRWEPQDGVHLPGFHPVPSQPASRPPSRQDEPAADGPAPGRVQHIAVRKRAEWQPDREN